MTDAALLEQFVASFEKLDEMEAFPEIFPFTGELRVGQPDPNGRVRWQHSKTSTHPASLDPLYAKLPARFPPLYELLVLGYRWAEVDLGSYRLLANPPGPDLSRLFTEMMPGKALWESLIPAGYVQFAKGHDMDFDPVCFDIKSRTKNKDYRVVKIDHEEILCNHRVKVVAEIAPTFRHLVLETIELANSPGK